MGLQRLLSPPARMILRHLERAPVKAFMSIFAIAMAVAIMVLGNFSVDSLNYIIDVQFHFAQRQDLNISFVEPRPARALYELQHLPGVRDSEPFRAVPVRLRHGHHSRRVGLLGFEPEPRLNLLINEQLQPIQLPQDGLVLADKMAELLQVQLGELVTVEVLEGERPKLQIPVVMLVKEFFGAGAYMSLDALNRVMREGRVISGGYLASDPKDVDALYYELKHTPGVSSVTVRKAAIKSFQETLAENMLMMRTFNIIFATIIAFGVVYNSARIALAERGRELASLRVMGFTRAEISAIFLGEMAVLTLLAIPLGIGLGYLFAWLTSLSLDTELYRIPMVVNAETYAFAVVVVLIATVVSGLVVRSKLDHLDLVAVLKTRE
jgi:putative ABC transport system permease protein